MEKNIYNSSGKIAGKLIINEETIDIVMNKKPILEIKKDIVGENLFSQVYNEELILTLYDTYTCPIGSIAAIFDVHYHIANKWIKQTPVITGKHTGCRNSSYGQIFSQSRIEKMSSGIKGGKIYNNGEKEIVIKPDKEIPEGFVLGRLPFSEETKAKLREEIIKMQNAGIMKKGKEAAQLGWVNGKFKDVNFKRGIGGWITSKKINKRFFFRSLLELQYILLIEEDPEIITYQYEPFIINCDNGTLYTPDFLINDSKVIELKSYKFVYSQGGEIQTKFEYKVQQATKYCQEHNYTYEVIYDKDINFDSAVFKHQLQQSDNIKKYNIKFAQPERFWSKK